MRQREELIAWRKSRGYPWHSPPHFPNYGPRHFLITAACYEHMPHIGFSRERIDRFSFELLEVLREHASQTVAWCVLPNHYHALLETPDILKLLHGLGQFHGRTSHAWNGEENSRGRHVFFRVSDRFMRSDRHFWATRNYVHNNPIHHGYAQQWTEWPWSSAPQFLEQIGPEEAKRIWDEYPVGEYGKDWDDALL